MSGCGIFMWDGGLCGGIATEGVWGSVGGVDQHDLEM